MKLLLEASVTWLRITRLGSLHNAIILSPHLTSLRGSVTKWNDVQGQ